LTYKTTNMKNPFIKDDNTLSWIAAGVGSVVAAGAGVWYYLRSRRLAAEEAYRHEHAQDYLQEKHPMMKKHKTDVSELGDLVHHAQA
jgi:hypothetical protein